MRLSMARIPRYFKSVALTCAQQIGRMASVHPGFRPRFRRAVVTWTGSIQPSPISETYTVRIEYALRQRPKVWIVRPRLRKRSPTERIPHTFSDGSVCLHLHEDWTPAMFIADFIVPMLALWLYYYEESLATGKWLGGGHEPGQK